MKKLSGDPLLAGAQILLIFLIGILGFGTLMMILGLPALIVFQRDVIAEMAAQGVANGAELILPIALVMAAVIGLLALTIYFLVLLRRIVSSVGERDPFAPVNADRLHRMGWLALAGQVASLPIGALIAWIAVEVGEQVENVHIDEEMGFSLSGLLLVLVLFILARVFRHGAAMREDLEGTV